jgi:hypothetical protein
VLVAAGKTIADERYNGVMKNDITNEMIAANVVTSNMVLRFVQMNCKIF